MKVKATDSDSEEEDEDSDLMPCSIFDFEDSAQPITKLQLKQFVSTGEKGGHVQNNGDAYSVALSVEIEKESELNSSANSNISRSSAASEPTSCDSSSVGFDGEKCKNAAEEIECSSETGYTDFKLDAANSKLSLAAKEQENASSAVKSESAQEWYKKRQSIIKQLPGIGGSRPMLVQKRLRAAFAKAKERGDPWGSFHIDELPGQLATRFRYNAKKHKWVEDEIIVKMERESFARGAMRSCHRMKKLTTIHSQDWKEASNYVAKRYIEPVEESVYLEDVKLQMDAKVWAELYNRMGPPKQIDIFQMCVIRMAESGELFHVEHFIEGEYTKYNSNSGFVDEHLRHTPHAFSHFTFEHSGHKLIVVDIQGVGDLYTDPQIHTWEGTEYGDGNLGTKGMALFFHSHICNPICALLKLSRFDLSENEVLELRNSSSKCLSPATTVVNPLRKKRTSPSVSSLSPTSEHAEKHFSFDSTNCNQDVNVQQQSPKSRSLSASVSPGTPPPNNGVCAQRRRVRQDTSMSFDFGSPLDEHFEANMKQHKPSGVNVDAMEAVLDSLDSESVLGEIHLQLAKYHELGRFNTDSEMDKDSALFHLAVAAQLNNAEAIKSLAQIYLQKENDVLPSVTVADTDENTNKGLDYMMQSAQKGDRASQVFMAQAFETGLGLGTKHSQDWKEAVMYYEMALNSLSGSGSTSAGDEPDYKLTAALANLFHKGGFGLDKDPSQAGDLYNEAAESAMAEFKGSLATKYFELAEVAWSEMDEEEE